MAGVYKTWVETVMEQQEPGGSLPEADNLTVTATGSSTARTLAERHADAASAKDFGLVGDGVTDDTAALSAAITSRAGKPIRFPPGTYVIDTVTITGAAELQLDEGATLKHRASSTNHLFIFTGTLLRIRGGRIDGNRLNQGAGAVRRYIVDAAIPSTARVDLVGVEFISTRAAGLHATNFGGSLTVDGCRFSDMMEHSGLASGWSCAVFVESGQVGAAGRFRFVNNTVLGTDTPSVIGANPGGVFFAPVTNLLAGEGNNSTFEATGNYFWGVGQFLAGTDMAAIHLYPVTNGARVIGNRFERMYFSAIAAKATVDFVCQGNTIFNGSTAMPAGSKSAASGAIYYTPGDHAAANVMPRAVISGNVIDSPGGEAGTPVLKQNGISVIGTSVPSYATQVLVNNNVISGAGVGVFVDYATHVTVANNVINGSTGGTSNEEHGAHLNHVDGVIKFSGNNITVPNGYALNAQTGLTTAAVLVADNYVKHTKAASYAFLLRGISLVQFEGNVADSASYAWSVAGAAAGETVTTLVWGRTNVLVAGTGSVDFAHVTNAKGHYEYPNAPDALAYSPVGTLYTRTTDGRPGLYGKRTAVGNASGWGAAVFERYQGLPYAASIAVDGTLATSYVIQPTDGAAFTVSSPSNMETGQRFTIKIYNAFGVLGAITWGAAYKLAAWTNPANGFSRSITFEWTGALAVEVSRTMADVPN